MAYCTGCGRSLDHCAGCHQEDPPHYCSQCGSWMAVSVTPTGWRATCREHGTLDEVTT
jgi:hypothetical protein